MLLSVRNRTEQKMEYDTNRRSSSRLSIDSTVPADEAGCSLVKPTDSEDSNKRVTRSSAMLKRTESLRRSSRLKFFPDFYESLTTIRMRTRVKSSTKRKAADEGYTGPVKKKITRYGSSRKKSNRTDKNSETKMRYRRFIEKTNSEDSYLVEDDDASSCEEDESEINRLPSEILGQIFKFLPSRDRKSARLVCRKWYDNCQNEKIKIRSGPKDEKYINVRYLGDCKFKTLNLSFEGISVSKIPVRLWRKIGSKIRSLECRLVTKTMKNIISYCHNLQHLYLRVSLSRQNEAYGLLTTLEELVNNNAINKELVTLEINLRDEVVHLSNNDLEIWRRILEAIYQIFPVIRNFSFSRYHFRNDGSVKYKCKFSRTKCSFNQVEVSSLERIFAKLAFSIFSEDDWVKSLDELSVLSLTNFELTFCKKKYTNEDGIQIRNFFVNQKRLKSVRIDFSSWAGIEILRSVLFGIVENCLELDKLSYIVPYHKHYLTPAECTALLQKMAHVKSVSISGFSITHSPMFPIASSTFKVSTLELSNVDEKICACFIRNYTWLQHLTLVKFVADEVLQSIFQYLTELKALDIRLDSRCTNFGITGRHSAIESNASTSGYSISRLRNLERLTINFEKAGNVSDRIILDFKFPRLRYLCCIRDQLKFKFVVAMCSKLPLLEEIKFTSPDMSLDSLLVLCKQTKKLYHLHTNVDLFSNKLGRIFNACPGLKLITNSSNNKIQYYSPDTKKIIRRILPY